MKWDTGNPVFPGLSGPLGRLRIVRGLVRPHYRMPPKVEVREILVLEPDRLCGAVLVKTIGRVFPRARVFHETDPGAAAVVLANRQFDLLVVAVRGFDLDIVTLLGLWAEQRRTQTRVLIVTPDRNSTALVALESLHIPDVFDVRCGDLRELELACRALADGQRHRLDASSSPTGTRRGVVGRRRTEVNLDCRKGRIAPSATDTLRDFGLN